MSTTADPLTLAYRKYIALPPSGDKLSSKKVTQIFKDSGLYTKKVTRTDTDIGFTSVATKGKKTINLKQFKKLVAICAKKEYPKKDPEAALAKVVETLDKAQKKLNAKKTKSEEKGGVVDRLTDSSGYTGSSKERFDKDGKGKGLAGTDQTKGSGAGNKNAPAQMSGGKKVNLSDNMRGGTAEGQKDAKECLTCGSKRKKDKSDVECSRCGASFR